MKAIVLAFTLKGQDFKKIAEQVKKVADSFDSNVIVIHGFMPRKEVVERGFPTDVVDLLEQTFAVRLNMYNGGPLREDMAEAANRLQATVCVVGAPQEGVWHELKLYKNFDLPLMQFPLSED